jgi:hypothetical protein
MKRRFAALTSVTMVLLFAVSIQAPASVGALSARASSEPLYLALGDSYSSGEGLAPFLAGSGSCDRSPEAYPPLVAHDLGHLGLVFVACSGATITQISAQVGAVSPGELRRAALTTVTAGGNDLGFSTLISACVGGVGSVSSPTVTFIPGVSSAASCTATIEAAASLLGSRVNPETGSLSRPKAALALPLTRPSTLEARLVALYRQILHGEGAVRHRASGPRLIVVPYPTLLSPPGAGSCLLSSATIPIPVSVTTGPLYPAFGNVTSVALRQINGYLQSETSIAVASLRREGYLDLLEAPLKTGFVPLDCATGTSPSMNGLLFSDTTATTVAGSLHPTAEGQKQLAASVVAAWLDEAR